MTGGRSPSTGLRRLFSTLFASGMDIKTMADGHGHSRATMTLDLYAHALPERDREAAGVLGQALEHGRSRRMGILSADGPD